MQYVATCYLLVFAHAAYAIVIFAPAVFLATFAVHSALRITRKPSHAQLRAASRNANLALLRGTGSRERALALHVEARNAGAYANSEHVFTQQPALCRAIHGDHASGVLCACYATECCQLN